MPVVKKPVAVLLLSAVVVSGIGAFAQAPRGAGRIDGAISTDAAQSTPPASTTLRVRGTIDKYDAATRILSLSTPKGTAQFPLASTARIRQGWQKINALDLEKLAGQRAAIRYSESGGNKIVESVHVFEKNERIDR